MSRRWPSTATALFVLLAFTGCGVPTDRKPRPLAPDAVPFGLLGSAATTPTTSPAGNSSAEVFFLRQGRLAAVQRSVQAPPTLSQLMSNLLSGPTQAEGGQGLETAIGGQIELRGVSAEGGVASIDLSSPFGSLEGTSQVDAVAQIVFTATGAPGVSAVRFLVEGQPVDVPNGDGTLSSGALGRADFSALGPV